MTKYLLIFVMTVLLVPALPAKVTPGRHNSLAEYLARMEQKGVPASAGTPGSLWRDSGSFSNLAADYKAVRVGDVVTILVAQDVTAQNSGSVATDRSFKASSGISAMAGHVSVSGVQNIFSPQSSQTLSGKAQRRLDFQPAHQPRRASGRTSAERNAGGGGRARHQYE